MKLNQDTAIIGQSVVLLPYEKNHVERYHKWMQSPEIQELTASEPLSLEQEYAMQQSWREDDDKLTFIVVDKSLWDSYETKRDQEHDISSEEHASAKEEFCMVGDVNLFLNDGASKETAEIEIMIAEVLSRNRGLATESLRLMMAYAVKYLGISKFIAKIGCGNVPSYKLFTQKLGFYEISRSKVFDEVSLEKNFDLSSGRDFVISEMIRITEFHSKIIDYHILRNSTQTNH